MRTPSTFIDRHRPGKSTSNGGVLESINPESVDSGVLSLSMIGLLHAFLAAATIGDEPDLLRKRGERAGSLTIATGRGCSGVGGTGLLTSNGVTLGLRESGMAGMGERGQTGTCCRRGTSLCGTCRSETEADSDSESVEKLSIEPDDRGGDRGTADCRGGGITSSGKTLLFISPEGEKSCINGICNGTRVRTHRLEI